MKLCSTCKIEKSREEFNKKSANTDGLERYCKECHRARNRAHYDDNKDAYKTSAKHFKAQLKEWYQELKSNVRCSRCGDSKPWRLSFHHTDPSAKEGTVSQMVMDNKSRAKVLAEIEKCIVVCHNCHADIHYEENRSLV